MFFDKDFILSSALRFLKPDKSGKGYVCPICGSGSGKHGTGIITKDGVHFTCWRGCYTSKDIIDIIGLKYGVTGYKEKLEKVCEEMGLPLTNEFYLRGKSPKLMNTHKEKNPSWNLFRIF